MKIIFSLILFYYSFVFQNPKEYKLKAQLANIEYYSKGICKDSSFVYVRVCYKVSGDNPENLRMKHQFNNGISSSMPVTEIDKKGNLIYGFCLAKDETREFITTFISSDGKISNKIFVKVDVAKADIIKGTAPITKHFEN